LLLERHASIGILEQVRARGILGCRCVEPINRDAERASRHRIVLKLCR
jgi:hypothetical protein